jgi:hypothetical protein
MVKNEESSLYSHELSPKTMSDSVADEGTKNPRSTLWLRVLLFLFLWIALLDFPHYVASVGNDTSWQRCLGYFLTHRLQCGVDYVWTYGPLGYFVNMVYDTDLFWHKYAWELIVKFAFAWILLRWTALLSAGWMRAAFLILVLCFLPGSIDTLYLFCTLLLGLLPLRDVECRTVSRLLAGAILLAVVSLTKFTFLILGVGIWGIVLLAPSLNGRLRSAWALGYLLSLAVLWTLLGQSLANFPRFLTTYFEIARGYGDAMAWEGPSRLVYLGLAADLGFVLLAAVYPLAALRRRENLLGIALVAASMFMVWKHGFIRQTSHAPYFFGYLLVVPFAVEGLVGEPKAKPMRVGWIASLLVLGVLGRGIPLPVPWAARWLSNGVFVLAPSQLSRRLEIEQHALAETWDLPEIRRIVGDRSVDLLTYSQGILFLNRLNYHPRPIFQSYSAYTPKLMEWNAAYYRSERAPAFVLCRLQPIDDRFPTLEDSTALLEIFRRYQYVTQENGLLLLRRREDEPTETAETPLLQRSITFDEPLRLDELGSSSKVVSIHMTNTLRGRVTSFLFRSPAVYLEVTTSDGETYSFRFIPNMAENGFLVDPLLRNHDDLEAYWTGQSLPRIRTLTIHPSEEARNCFENHLSITVRPFEKR